MQPPHAPSWACLPSVALRAVVVVCRAVLVCVIAGMLLPRRAAADEAGLREVHITLVGKLAREPSLPERFTSWFDAAQYRVSVREQAVLDSAKVLSPPPDAGVYVWVTLRSDTQARLYFATASTTGAPLYALRELSLDSGLDEVAAERLSQIVHLSALALFDGQGEHERGEVARMLDEEVSANPSSVPLRSPPPALSAPPPSPPPPQPSAPEPPPPRPEAPASSFDFGVGYALSPRSDEGLWHGPALRAGLRFGIGLVLELEAQGYLPMEEDIQTVRLRFWGLGFGAGAGWGFRWSSGWYLSGALGPRVEVVSYQPVTSFVDTITPVSGDVELRPEVGVTGRLGVSGARLGAGLFARAAYALSRTHYDLRTDASEREIAAPSRFLPTLGLELAF